MKLVKSLQKTLNPFTKMVKKNKLMLLLGVLLLLGLVLLVKMYMNKMEGFNEAIMLKNVVFGKKDDTKLYKLVYENYKTELKEGEQKYNIEEPTSSYYKSKSKYYLQDLGDEKYWWSSGEKIYKGSKYVLEILQGDDKKTYKLPIGDSVVIKATEEIKNSDGNVIYSPGDIIDLKDYFNGNPIRNVLYELKTKFGLDEQPTDINNASAKIKAKYNSVNTSSDSVLYK